MISNSPLLETSSHHVRYVLSNQSKYFFAAYWNLFDLLEIGNLNLASNALSEINRSILSMGVLNLDEVSIKWMEYLISLSLSYFQQLNYLYLNTDKDVFLQNLGTLESLFELAKGSSASEV